MKYIYNLFEQFILSNSTFINFNDLSLNESISIDFILSNRQFPWTWDKVLKRHDFNANIILTHPDIHWSLDLCSNIPKNILLMNPDLDWNPYDMDNVYVPIDLVGRYPSLAWNYFRISRHPDLTLSVIQATLNRGWAWSTISSRTDFIYNEWSFHNRIHQLVVSLSYFSPLPVYLLADILTDEYPYLSYYDLFHIIKDN